MEGKISKTELDDLKNLRCERKFIITELCLKEIEHLIKHNPAIFSEIFYERKVNNIYFDSLDFKNYRENLSGDSQRLKIRIRWYGQTFGLIKNPVLELKIKKNEFGKKLSFPIKSFILKKEFSTDSLQKVFAKSNLPEWLTEKLRLYHAPILNFYKRRYFIAANKKHRITLDWNMVFVKLRNNNNSFFERISHKEHYVLEVKCPAQESDKTAEITKYFPTRLNAHSKYVVGIDLLEW